MIAKSRGKNFATAAMEARRSSVWMSQENALAPELHLQAADSEMAGN
jgi:hypothetical protein